MATLAIVVYIHWSVVGGSQFSLRYQPVGIRMTHVNSFPFQNTSLPWNVRVDDLVSRLSLDEIQLQMARGGAGIYGGPAPPIPRLG